MHEAASGGAFSASERGVPLATPSAVVFVNRRSRVQISKVALKESRVTSASSERRRVRRRRAPGRLLPRRADPALVARREASALSVPALLARWADNGKRGATSTALGTLMESPDVVWTSRGRVGRRCRRARRRSPGSGWRSRSSCAPRTAEPRVTGHREAGVGGVAGPRRAARAGRRGRRGRARRGGHGRRRARSNRTSGVSGIRRRRGRSGRSGRWQRSRRSRRPSWEEGPGGARQTR